MCWSDRTLIIYTLEYNLINITNIWFTPNIQNTNIAPDYLPYGGIEILLWKKHSFFWFCLELMQLFQKLVLNFFCLFCRSPKNVIITYFGLKHFVKLAFIVRFSFLATITGIVTSTITDHLFFMLVFFRIALQNLL